MPSIFHLETPPGGSILVHGEGASSVAYPRREALSADPDANSLWPASEREDGQDGGRK